VTVAGPWYDTTVIGIRDETQRAKTFRLQLPQPMDFLAGQHLIVRLTAPDGYRAQRSYSVASAPDNSDELELTVELLEGGEVSGFLHDVVEVGDTLEVRGPLGGFFVWHGSTPALLVGGGAGVVPLMAMLRLARRTGRSELVRLVVSTRSPAELFYGAELPGPEASIIYTRSTPEDWPRAAGRLMASDIPPLHELGDVTAYVCGSAGFCDTAGDLLVGLGQPVDRIKVERFGPTG
jgi:ferredoxin-NADP reductase